MNTLHEGESSDGLMHFPDGFASQSPPRTHQEISQLFTPRLHTSELLSHEVHESMGIVWCRNHSGSHELLSSVALLDEFT